MGIDTTGSVIQTVSLYCIIQYSVRKGLMIEMEYCLIVYDQLLCTKRGVSSRYAIVKTGRSSSIDGRIPCVYIIGCLENGEKRIENMENRESRIWRIEDAESRMQNGCR